MEPLQHDLSVLRDKEFSAGKEFDYMLKQSTQKVTDEVFKV